MVAHQVEYGRPGTTHFPHEPLCDLADGQQRSVMQHEEASLATRLMALFMPLMPHPPPSPHTLTQNVYLQMRGLGSILESRYGFRARSKQHV